MSSGIRPLSESAAHSRFGATTFRLWRRNVMGIARFADAEQGDRAGVFRHQEKRRAFSILMPRRLRDNG